MRRIGQITDNQEVGTTDRPELFQEADAVQAREVVAERAAATPSAGMAGVAWDYSRFECVFEWKNERGARGAGASVRSLPYAEDR